MKLLGPDGMSSDESESEELTGSEPHRRSRDGPPVYCVLSPRWRSDELTRFLHLLDSVHLALRRMDPSRQRGSWPRVRRYNPDRQIMSSSQKFVPNLPRNAYDASFL